MRDLILHQLDQFLRPKFLQPMPQIAQALNDGIDAFQMMNPCIENGSRVFPCTSLKTDPARRPPEVAWLVATFVPASHFASCASLTSAQATQSYSRSYPQI